MQSMLSMPSMQSNQCGQIPTVRRPNPDQTLSSENDDNDRECLEKWEHEIIQFEDKVIRDRRDPVPAPAAPGQVPVPQQVQADEDEISGAEINRNVTAVDRSNVSPPVESDGPMVRRFFPQTFHKQF